MNGQTCRWGPRQRSRGGAIPLGVAHRGQVVMMAFACSVVPVQPSRGELGHVCQGQLTQGQPGLDRQPGGHLGAGGEPDPLGVAELFGPMAEDANHASTAWCEPPCRARQCYWRRSRARRDRQPGARNVR